MSLGEQAIGIKTLQYKEKSGILRLPIFGLSDKTYELSFAPIVVGNPQFSGAQNEQIRAAFAKFGVVKFK